MYPHIQYSVNFVHLNKLNTVHYNSLRRDTTRERAGYGAQDLISTIEMKAVSSFSALSCLKWFQIECCMKHITGYCDQKGSYPVMNSTGGQMLQRMGNKTKAEEERDTEMQKKKKEKGREGGREGVEGGFVGLRVYEEKNMSEGIE